MKVEDAKEAAKLANCPEIVRGIPFALSSVITEETSLPMVFEEPEDPPENPPRDLAAEIDELKAKLKKAGIIKEVE